MANIPASDITNPGTATLTVYSPAPGGGVSNPATFTINSANPTPSLTVLVPKSTTIGSGKFLLHVVGRNLVSSSKIKWNGTELPTTHYTSGPSADDVVSAAISADKSPRQAQLQ